MHGVPRTDRGATDLRARRERLRAKYDRSLPAPALELLRAIAFASLRALEELSRFGGPGRVEVRIQLERLADERRSAARISRSDADGSGVIEQRRVFRAEAQRALGRGL